jgi:hypothetical protein
MSDDDTVNDTVKSDMSALSKTEMTRMTRDRGLSYLGDDSQPEFQSGRI